MQPNEKTDDKASLQANQQPKKTWQEPVLANLDINGGNVVKGYESLADDAKPFPPPSGVY
jgi:hypothetical protein